MWGMINSLNILVHIPLINLAFPANMEVFMSFLIRITNFNLLPNDFIYNGLLEFTASDPENLRFDEVDIFTILILSFLNLNSTYAMRVLTS